MQKACARCCATSWTMPCATPPQAGVLMSASRRRRRARPLARMAERERVFDRFYRRAGAPAPGSGLGLAIVQAIAAAHGATVSLSDGPGGKGLTVTVVFPP